MNDDVKKNLIYLTSCVLLNIRQINTMNEKIVDILRGLNEEEILELKLLNEYQKNVKTINLLINEINNY